MNDISFGTVRDYCDSADSYPELSCFQHDLKDAQRPWAVKVIRSLLPPGSRLLEIGGGQPLAATVLANHGYDVTVVDPMDGLDRGPENFDEIQSHYSQVRIIRELYTTKLAREMNETFDCMFSISVLEHVPLEGIVDVFAAARMSLRPGGFSVHALDYVMEGEGQALHKNQLLRVFREQNTIAESRFPDWRLRMKINHAIRKSRKNLDTYYLSAMGHNQWRGQMDYDDFPFRKCTSMQFVAQRPETAIQLRAA